MVNIKHISPPRVTVYSSSAIAALSLLVSERSEQDTIRGVQIRAGAVYVYICIYICMEVCVP